LLFSDDVIHIDYPFYISMFAFQPNEKKVEKGSL